MNDSVILLVAPNDESLNEIAEEIDQIEVILTAKRIHEKAFVLPEKGVNLNNFSNKFLAYKNRITCLHFSGHAGMDKLLFSKEMISAGGVASFLDDQPYLSFVFLNGCSTVGQVHQLFEHKIPAVMATSAPVGDKKAKTFALTFYKYLANDYSLKAAFEATNALLTEKRIIDKPVEIFKTRSVRIRKDRNAQMNLWGLYINDQFPWIENWKISDIYKNPFTRLPRISDSIGYPFRPSPFKGLKWYEAADARIFFGRTKEIKAIYKVIDDIESPKILLLHGQSGVGKSSLLNAGLLPRLKDNFPTEHYIRENHIENLSKIKIGASNTIIIFDQLEELILAGLETTRAFLTKLKSAPFYQSNAPVIKIIFAFRKEFFADFQKRLNELEIAYRDRYIEPLEMSDIEQTISGLSLLPATREQYKLTIDKRLPSKISAYLSLDGQSSIAPTLQLLLTTLWDKAKVTDDGNRTFDVKLFDDIKEKGSHLSAYSQKLLLEWEADTHPIISKYALSGLFLDLLNRLVTKNLTAKSLTLPELKQGYLDHKNTVISSFDLNLLLEKLESHYLIFKVGNQQSASENTKYEQISYRLAHDTLAPIVVQEFNSSIRPGQQAKRLMSSKLMTNTPLNFRELMLVKKGEIGRNLPNEKEKGLIKASWRKFVVSSIIVTLCLIGFGFAIYLGYTTQKREISAKLEVIKAQINDGEWQKVNDNYKLLLRNGYPQKDTIVKHLAHTIQFFPNNCSTAEAKEYLMPLLEDLPAHNDFTSQARASMAFWLSYTQDTSLARKQLEACGFSIPSNTDKVELRKLAEALLIATSSLDRMKAVFFPTFVKVASPIDQANQHFKAIQQPFYISTYELTYQNFIPFINLMNPNDSIINKEKDNILANNGIEFKEEKKHWAIKYSEEEDYKKIPFEQTYHLAKSYCKWAGYRFPTKEEWEFAASGGNKSQGFQYAGSNDLKEIAVFNLRHPKPVSSLLPNELGLYDMSGNLAEFYEQGNTTSFEVLSKGGNYLVKLKKSSQLKISSTYPYPLESPYGVGLRPVKNGPY